MHSVTYSHPALKRFAILAEDFCAIVEARRRMAAQERLKRIHGLLAQLYAAALELPATDVLFDDVRDSPEDDTGLAVSEPCPEEAPLPRPELSDIAELLGSRVFYREIFDPYAPPSDAEVGGDLVDDLLDIHCDLSKGLIRWRRGETGDALWEWRFSFESHWGEHATSALRALYACCAWHKLDWPAGAV